MRKQTKASGFMSMSYFLGLQIYKCLFSNETLHTLRYCCSIDSLSFLVLSESSGSTMIFLRTTSRVKTPTLFWLSAQTGFPFLKNS